MSEEVLNNDILPTETPSENKSPKKKEKSKARKIVEWILFGIFGVLFVFILAGNISAMVTQKENYGQSLRFGWGSFVVLTDSMEPEYKVDSAIITYKEDVEKVYKDYQAGNTVDVTFMNINNVAAGFDPDNSRFVEETIPTNVAMTHRLFEMHYDDTKDFGNGRYIFVVAGINDGGNLSKQGQYQVFTEKEYLGVVKINSAFLGGIFKFVGSALGLLVLLLIPAGYLIVTSGIDIYKALKEKEDLEESGASSSGSTLDTISEKDRERLKQELLEEMLNSKKGNDNE